VNGKEVLDHVAFYIPYIWVTNAYTMATGRESFRYPKSFGWAEMATSPTSPGPLWADGLVLPDVRTDDRGLAEPPAHAHEGRSGFR